MSSANEVWLITGGAGYIGTHVADEFIKAGKDVVLYDSLYQGLESRVQYLRTQHNKEIPLVVEDIRNYEAFEKTIKDFQVTGIVHTAALKAVGESMEKPDEYMDVNYTATTKLLDIAQKCGIKKFIFSSTAAVYGSPDSMDPCSESGPTDPISPYGASKLLAEAKVEEFAAIPGNIATSLRFFNVVGATNRALLDNSVENLVPIVINKLKAGEPPVIFGTNYPTPDGTCIRDYVDVRDIARAHLAVGQSKNPLPSAINIGTGKGASVREIIGFVLKAAHKSETKSIEAPRRAGDPAFLCADVTLAKSALRFSSRYSLEESINSLF